jgi:hypothetical protein
MMTEKAGMGGVRKARGRTVHGPSTHLRWIVPTLALAVAWPCLSELAYADTELSRQAVAERLFQAGKSAMEQRRYELACGKLKDSQRLDPAGGTVLLLALCLEARGKLASAWLGYQEALSFAHRDGRADRAARARQRIRAIEPRLVRLYLRTPSGGPDVSVRVDGTDVPESAYETGLPLDPGEHVVAARARGFAVWAKRIQVRTEGERIDIDIPAFRRERPRPAPAPRSHAQKDWATVLLAAGGSALAAGLIAGGIAWHRDSRANEICAGTECTDARAVDENEQARNAAAFATVTIGVGLALGITGGVLLWTAPGSREAAGVHWSAQW